MYEAGGLDLFAPLSSLLSAFLIHSLLHGLVSATSAEPSQLGLFLTRRLLLEPDQAFSTL